MLKIIKTKNKLIIPIIGIIFLTIIATIIWQQVHKTIVAPAAEFAPDGYSIDFR